MRGWLDIADLLMGENGASGPIIPLLIGVAFTVLTVRSIPML